MDQLGEIGLLVAGQVQHFGFFALLIDDVLQAVNVALDFDELLFDEFIRLLVDQLPRSSGIFDVAGRQCIQKFNGAVLQNVVDLQFEDAGLTHPGHGKSAPILIDDLLVTSDLEALALRNGLLDRAAFTFGFVDKQAEIAGLDFLAESMLPEIGPTVLQQDVQFIVVVVEDIQVEIGTERGTAELLRECVHFHAAQSTHGERPDPPYDEMGDVMIEVPDGFGDKIPAFQNSDLICDVRSLTLKSATDDAFHHFSGLVVFVFLFEQDFRLRTVLVQLLVRDKSCVTVGQCWKQCKHQPIFGRNFQGKSELLQTVVGGLGCRFEHLSKLRRYNRMV